MDYTQSYRVGWSALIREPTPLLTLFAVKNIVGRSTGGRVESTQFYRVGCIPLKRRPTPWLTLFAGLSTEGRVESSQSYRVAWSVLISGPTPWLTLFAVRNSWVESIQKVIFVRYSCRA